MVWLCLLQWSLLTNDHFWILFQGKAWISFLPSFSLTFFPFFYKILLCILDWLLTLSPSASVFSVVGLQICTSSLGFTCIVIRKYFSVDCTSCLLYCISMMGLMVIISDTLNIMQATKGHNVSHINHKND